MTASLHLFRFGIGVDGFRGVLFTGKFVKSLILRVIPEKKDLFAPSKSGYPKLVHVSPLYEIVNGRLRCVYSSVPCRGGRAKCDGVPEKISLSGNYFFYFGFADKVLDLETFLDRMQGIEGCFNYMGRKTCVRLYEVDYSYPIDESRKIARKVIEVGKLKIIFSSPTMLRDPFKRTKHKSLIPTVFNIFSTPIYIYLHLNNIYSLKRFRRQLLILHKLFNEPYSALKTIKLKWIIYKKKPEPTITGYMNLYINKDYLQYYSRYINIEEYLGEIFNTMRVLGVGVGRATGFGHVFIETPPNKQATNK